MLDPNIFDNGVDPRKFPDKLFQRKTSCIKDLEHLYKEMLFIRTVEEKLALERKMGAIGGPVHLGAGQEAIAVGISQFLTNKDKVFGAHRSHAHILSLNNDARALFAEVLGRDTGFSKGMGGSMHLWNAARGFYGSVPIVAGTVPLAVGAGLASRLLNEDTISVAYLGDGAIEEGVVAESLNLSRTLNSRTLFVIENNLFSSHMHISLRQPFQMTQRFAHANGIKSFLVDGNDINMVSEAADKLIRHIKKTSEPAFLEAITYRFYGHVDWREDIDVGVDRSKENLSLWKERDPLIRLMDHLKDAYSFEDNYFIDLKKKIKDEISIDWEKALNDPYPDNKELMNRVYATK